MDSSSSNSRSSSVGTDNRDYTGTYRSSDASELPYCQAQRTTVANYLSQDGYTIDVKHNTKGPREVVIVQHNTKSTYDPAEPRSSDSYRH
jgi:hypothetical protein